MRRHHDVHVCADPHAYLWRVRRGGRTISHHRTQRNAVLAARRAARRSRVDLVTHGRDGRIRSNESLRDQANQG